jgi:hydrogenase nickel incorporation protein HypA/HybF
MHEMGMANSILEVVRTEVWRCGKQHPLKVGVRIGEMAAIEPEALRFCFQALVRDTELDELELEIEWCPRQHRCRNCGMEFAIRDYDFECPECRSLESECIGGDELELAYLEVEEHEPSATGTQGSQ